MKTAFRAKHAQVEIAAIRWKQRIAAPCVAGSTKNRIAVAVIRGTSEDVTDINVGRKRENRGLNIPGFLSNLCW